MSRTSAMMSENPVDPADARANALLAMKIFMASWTLGFFALIGAYFYLRFNAAVWPPAGSPRPPLALTALSTAVAVGSSVVLQRGVAALDAGRRAVFVRALGLATVLGALFLGVQVAAGAQAAATGLIPGLNAYAGMFWVTAAFHALHVVVGVIALAVLFTRARNGAYAGDDTTVPRLWVYFWHGVDFVWLCVFFTMFLPG
jgi:heme/copper-type cytochrome/quinol oxidase subunit 3